MKIPLPLQLAGCVGFAFLFGSSLPIDVVQWTFTASWILKEGLMTLIPWVIISYLSAAFLSFESRAPVVFIGILGLICLSNAVSTLVAYGVAQVCLPFLSSGIQWSVASGSPPITSLIDFTLPKPISSLSALGIGMAYGLIFTFFPHPKASALALRSRDLVTEFLKKIFIPLLPVYVLGFVLKLQKEGGLLSLFTGYGQVLLCMMGLIVFYIMLLYMVAYRFNPQGFLPAMRRMGPAALTGFTTLSSAAAMPVTLVSTETNLKDPRFSHLVISTTVNIHLLGDALGVPFIGLALLSFAGEPLPSFFSYLGFVGAFCLAKFSSAGIPGGGVLILLPTLQMNLGLTPDMISLMTTLYILQDCLFTSANVMGNGAFALLCHRFFLFFKIIAPVDVDPVQKKRIEENSSLKLL